MNKEELEHNYICDMILKDPSIIGLDKVIFSFGESTIYEPKYFNGKPFFVPRSKPDVCFFTNSNLYHVEVKKYDSLKQGNKASQQLGIRQTLLESIFGDSFNVKGVYYSLNGGVKIYNG